MTRIAWRPVPALLVLLLAAACTSAAPSPEPSAPSPAPVAAERLDASVAQFRFDEGTRNLKAGVTNGSDRDIRVTEATIDWDAMAFPTVRIADPLTRPGQTAAFTIRYGEPRCAVPISGRPTLVAVVDGQRRRLQLRVEDPGLLRRLRAKACAAQRLDAVAGVTLRLEPRTVRVGRAEYVPGAVLLSRRPGGSGVVRLVDLGGSVLLVLVPRGGPSALPGRLGPGSARTAFPVLLGSAHRCDAHARGQSSQTFLISAYVRLDDAPTQRVVLPLSSAERDRLLGLIDRDCGTAEGS